MAPDTDDQMKVGKMKVDKITKLLSLNDCTQNYLIQNESWQNDCRQNDIRQNDIR